MDNNNNENYSVEYEDNGEYLQENYYDYEQDNVDYNEEYNQNYDEEYEEDFDDENSEHRFHIAMNMFNIISILIGPVVILLLVSLLISLFTWLQSDISQSITLFTSNIN